MAVFNEGKFFYEEFPANDNRVAERCENVNYHHWLGDTFIHDIKAMPDCKVGISKLMLTNRLSQFLVKLDQDELDARIQATLLQGALSKRLESLAHANGNPETDIVTMPVAKTDEDRETMRSVFFEAQSAVKAVLDRRACCGSVRQAILNYIDHRAYTMGLPGTSLRMRRLLFPVALGGHVLMVGMEAEGDTLTRARRAYIDRGGRVR